jgi:hypothetical protein
MIGIGCRATRFLVAGAELDHGVTASRNRSSIFAGAA